MHPMDLPLYSPFKTLPQYFEPPAEEYLIKVPDVRFQVPSIGSEKAIVVNAIIMVTAILITTGFFTGTFLYPESLK